MKVYIVEEGQYDPNIIGVFSTTDRAEKFIEKDRAKNHGVNYQISEAVVDGRIKWK